MKKWLVAVVVVLVAVLLTASVVSAREYTVNQEGIRDFDTIQEAIDAAIPGDAISVYPGTYRENIYFDGKDIGVTAVVGLMAVIDGGGNGPAVQFAGTETESCILDGFIITNGLSVTGGGIRGANDQHGYMGDQQYAQAQIRGCYLIANTALVAGGAVSEFNGSFSYCAIVGNTCENGYGGGFAGGVLELWDCEVEYNRGNYGGGFSFVTVFLTGSLGGPGNKFANNIAHCGGVFYCSTVKCQSISLDMEDRNQAEEGNYAFGSTFVLGQY